MSKINILIADDHALVREGIISMLNLFDDIRVVGEAADGKEAIEKTAKLNPDIVLMDIAMPGLGGLESTIEIKKKHPQVKILILSQYDDKEYVSRFMKAGISGYILKRAVGTELVTAIRSIAKGGSYIYPQIASSIIDDYIHKNKPMLEDPFEKLTKREIQVLKLIADGNSHKEIANFLDISAKTVIAHQSNISEKLDIHTRAGLIKYAIKTGIIKLDTF